MNYKLLSIIAVGAMLLTAFAAVDTSAEDAGFDITDGEGRTFHYDAPAEHIVSTGMATTLTIAEAGAIDKIVAVDKYSTYAYTNNELLASLNAVDLESFYGTGNHDNIVATLVDLVEMGKMSVDDTIILTSYPDNRILYEELTTAGFTKVLVWVSTSIESYDDLVQMVTDVSMIATGTVPDSIKQMNQKIQTVTDAVSGIADEDRAKALFVWYSGGEFSIGNTGIMNSMLEVCKADIIGYCSKHDTYYGRVNTIISLLDENPGTVIFVNYSYGTAGKTADDFRNEVLGGDTSYPVVIMESIWNNWCPESADGITAIGQYLYPELLGEPYEGYIDEFADASPADNGSNVAVYIVIAIVIIIVVAAAAFVMVRRKP